MEEKGAEGVSSGVEQVDHKGDVVICGDLADVVAGLNISLVGKMKEGVAVDSDVRDGRYCGA